MKSPKFVGFFRWKVIFHTCFFATNLLATIPPENNLTLVFLGASGAGKSTILNAFYNFANQVEWNKYPKKFPIGTDFQACNVSEYSHRSTENFTRKQLASVTKEPALYRAEGDNFAVHLIDTPGAADTRGAAQDLENNASIAEFIAGVGSFHAICLVLTSSTIRSDAYVKKWLQQILTLIPKDASDRVFLLISRSTTTNEDAIELTTDAGIPISKIFAFDNFGLSRGGHIDVSGVNLALEEKTVTRGRNPFALSAKTNVEILKDVAQKIQDTWISSHREFNRLLCEARELGSYSSGKMGKIGQIFRAIQQKTLDAQKRQESFSQQEIHLLAAYNGLQQAYFAYGDHSTKNLIDELGLMIAKSKKELDLQNAIVDLNMELEQISLGCINTNIAGYYDGFYSFEQ